MNKVRDPYILGSFILMIGHVLCLELIIVKKIEYFLEFFILSFYTIPFVIVNFFVFLSIVSLRRGDLRKSIQLQIAVMVILVLYSFILAPLQKGEYKWDRIMNILRKVLEGST